MGISRHSGSRDLRGSFDNEATRASMPFLIAICVVALMLSFLPEIVALVPDLIFGKR